MGYILKGYIEVPMEEVENIKKYLNRHIQNTLEESGCLEFRVEQDSADKSVFDVITKFVVVEMEVVDLHRNRRWVDESASTCAQQTFAEKVGVTRQTIIEIEKG